MSDLDEHDGIALHLGRTAHQEIGALRARVAALEWQRIGAAAEQQQTAADSFALGVFTALLVLWLAARLSGRLRPDDDEGGEQ